jgi:hypothetical protein
VRGLPLNGLAAPWHQDWGEVPPMDWLLAKVSPLAYQADWPVGADELPHAVRLIRRWLARRM